MKYTRGNAKAMALLRARRQQKYDFADKARWPKRLRSTINESGLARANTASREARGNARDGRRESMGGRGEVDGGDGQQGDDDAERKIDRWRPGVIGHEGVHAHTYKTHTHTHIRRRRG